MERDLSADKDASAQGFRARAAQLLSWLTGIQQQERQQQAVQTDRQIFDGMTRGNDDPDNRRQAQWPAIEEAPRQAQRAFQARWQDHAIEAYGPEHARWLAEQQGRRHDMPTPHDFPKFDGELTLRERLRLNAEQRVEGARYKVSLPHEQQGSETSLTARVEALQQRLQDQQWAQQQGRQRGQGMGW